MNWIILILALVLGGQAHAYNYCDDAVGCWLFTDTDYNGGAGTTVDDASPNSNTGTFKGAGEPAWDTTDISLPPDAPKWTAPNSVSFDGVNDYINVGNSSSINPVAPLTFSFWFKRTGTMSVAFPVYITDNSYVGGVYYGIVVSINTLNTIELSVGDGSGAGAASRASTTTDSAAISSANVWYHVVVQYVNTTNMAIYINGRPVDVTRSGSGDGTISTNTANDYMGYWPNVPRYGSGYMSESALFLSALDSTDISAIYDYGLQGQQSTTTYSIIRNSIIRNSIIR
jgi:hypothetical protein